jgi:hypothetical protein
MSRRIPLLIGVAVLVLWVVLTYELRYGLMEDVQWVSACVADPGRWQCQLRSNVGMIVYLGYIGQSALAAAVLGFVIPGRIGKALAVLGLLIGAIGLVLYSASLSAFAVVLAALRLVRTPRRA